MYLSVCVLALLATSASAMLQHRKKFHFLRSQYRRSDDCNICYDGDCLPLDQSRCDYYEAVDSLMQPGDEDPEGLYNPQLRQEVDGRIHNIIEKASLTPNLECIPYISRFTNCNKENVCIGCKTCNCSPEGKWNCSSTTRCRMEEPAIDIDHRILIMAIDNLNAETKTSRSKRAVPEKVLDKIVDTMTLEQLSEWFYGAKPIEKTANKPDVLADTKESEKDDVKRHIEGTFTPLPTIAEEAYMNTESDYLAFDEVLSNIAVDTKNYTRRKPPPEIEADNSNKTIEFDYMLLDEESKFTKDNSSANNMTDMGYVVNYMNEETGVTENPADDTTKIVIDLLESAKPNYYSLFNESELTELGINKEDLLAVGFDNNNDILDISKLNIMKRDTSSITGTKKALGVTNVTQQRPANITKTDNNTGTTDKKLDLKEDVLLPLIEVINNKKNEFDNLKIVKDNLIGFMNHHNQSPIVEIIDYPDDTATNLLKDLEMFPDIQYDLRRTNPDLKQKFLFKLKNDIYEVIKDILALQRYRDGDLPEDLNVLIHALKKYVAIPKPVKRRFKVKSPKNYRRTYDSNASTCLTSTFKQCIVEVLQTIDKDMPTFNALGSLTPTTRRIMRHILRTLYSDELTSIGLKVHDPNYNMSNDLRNIGSNWDDMDNIVGSSPFITLYRMKLLQYYLEMDINKLNEALTLVAFAHSRRMTPYFKSVHKNVIEKINKGLNSIHNKVEIVVKYYSKKKEDEDDAPGPILRSHDDETTELVNIEKPKPNTEERQQKKQSFINYIRNLLKSSKKDIHELLHRQVPKSEIVKQLARKKLDELAQKRYNEYEDAMRKWQKNLGVMTRYRRNADELSNRIKSIIPKYLRHKVKPKIHEKKKNSTHKDKKGKKKKKHARQNRHKKTTLTTATTPKTRATTKPMKIRKTTVTRKATTKGNITKT